ncbi:MAG: ATP-binding cassette domain-containing protein, partial [Xanthomonadales bacterium]|nr:ATP-binding cassette domain-containing protein [Xanthomonadales bacterium]
MDFAISIEQLGKTYANGHVALADVNLQIRRGEIFALLGPHGAGKSTLIGIVCGLLRLSSGRVIANGFDIQRDYRAARASIGLVPQELATETFETIWA